MPLTCTEIREIYVTVIFSEVKWQGHEADHSTPSSAEVKNGGAIPPLPLTSWLIA
jgi:hypothetical protein